LSDCRVPVENVLGGEEGHGLQQALSALEFGRVNIAGRAVGVAQASLDRSLAYARERQAFGRPIAEFQAIQLKLADMATEVQAARLLTWWAASALDSGRRADLQTGMAKLTRPRSASKHRSRRCASTAAMAIRPIRDRTVLSRRAADGHRRRHQ